MKYISEQLLNLHHNLAISNVKVCNAGTVPIDSEFSANNDVTKSELYHRGRLFGVERLINESSEIPSEKTWYEVLQNRFENCDLDQMSRVIYFDECHSLASLSADLFR